MPRSERDAEDRELGKPGPVLDRDGVPVVGPDGQPLLDGNGEPVRVAVGPDGKPLEKVLVVTRRDGYGDVTEAVWMDPRIAWQYDESRWQ